MRVQLSGRTRRLVGAATALIMIVSAGAVGVSVSGASPEPGLRRDSLRVAAGLRHSATPATTTTLAPPAPLPAEAPVAPPADDYADEPHVVIGSIEIPALGLSVPLNQGISLRSIDRGPSHWPGTALPGDPGNVVIAGHRVTKTRPFRDIDKLVPGDEIIFNVNDRRSVYRVTGSEIVTPDAMRIVDQTATPTGTLFACHPPGSARFRYVVKMELDTTT